MSKYALIGCLLQAFFYPFLFAESTKGQKSIENIFVTIELNESKLKEVFTKIEKLTDFRFAYKKGEIRNKESLSIHARYISIGNLLRQIARETNLKFKRVNEIIHVTENNSIQYIVMEEQLPDRPVRGKVTDENGEELPGVNVFAKGTTIGTITDSHGDYMLEIPDDVSTLVFSYVGYITEEVEIAARSVVDMSLTPDVETLSEIVVVGYGTTRREVLSGAVDMLDYETLQDLPLTNPIAGLQGRIAGTVVTRTSGRPGEEGFNIQIRGASTVNGNSNPLIIIDGVPGAMSDLNPNDIESMNVLKDASAAIYGARASNGVILITTKKGKSGKPRVNVNSSYTLRRPGEYFEQLDSYRVALMDREAAQNAGITPTFTDQQIEAIRNRTGEPIVIPGFATVFADTWDYTDLAFNNGSQQNHDINISGATDKFSYRASLGYLKENGIFTGPDDNQRLNTRLNLGFNPVEGLNIDTRLAISRQRTRQANQEGLGQINRIFPWMRPFTVDDPTKYATAQGYQNPLQRQEEGGTNTNWDTRVESNMKIDYEIIENLTISTQVGANLRFQDFRQFARTFSFYDEVTAEVQGLANSPNRGTEGFSREVYSTLIGYVNYSNTFMDKHDLSVTLGASHEQNDVRGFSASRTGFPSNDFFSLNLGDSDNQTNDVLRSNGTPIDAIWTIRSLFGRASYVYNHKYIFEFNTRYDGSSRFAPDTRWGLFWGVSGAWQLGEEAFIRNLNFIDALKLRLSYSETGNQEGIGLYDYIGTITVTGEYPFGNGGRVARANVGNLVDPSRTWETLQTSNIGLDFGLLDNRLSGSVDYFIKRNVDMLVPINVPAVLGSPAPAGNNGELETKGWEINLNWQDDIGENFSYFINFNIGDARNEVVNFGGQDTYSEGRVQIREGQMINTYHGWVFDGIIQNQEQLNAYRALEGVPGDIGIGDAMYKDVNGDGRISTFGDNGEVGDVVPIGNPTPRYNYGVNMGVTYKNFEFSAFFQGVGEKDIFLDGDWSAPWFWPWHKPDARFWNTTWSPERPDARYPRMSHGPIRRWNYNKNTNNLIDASYIRLKNVTIAYNLPQNVTERIGVERLKVFVTGFDLWEKHNIGGGFDPESLTATQTIPQAYPLSRMYTAGLNMTF